MERTYEIIPGFFCQDDPTVTPASLFPRFGLLDDSPDCWISFQARINELNKAAPANTSFKVLFLARHGEGFHNVAIEKFGVELWESYWGILTGDGELTWGPDPDITERGKSQAIEANNLWKSEVAKNIPLPQKMYCSPLTRAMRTNVITFDGIPLASDIKTIVVENCREENGVHSCDMRRSKTYILSEFPQFVIENDFTEADELWRVEARETMAEMISRVRSVLDMIFNKDSETYISITAHSGTVNAFLAALGRTTSYELPTGGVLPVVVKSTRSLAN